MIDYATAYLKVADLSEATLSPAHAADIAAWIVETQHYSLADRIGGAPRRERRLAQRHREALDADHPEFDPEWRLT